MAQLIKSLPQKQGDLSLIPRRHIEEAGCDITDL